MSKNKSTKIALTLSATNHGTETREENDYYATDPKALYLFLNRYDGEINKKVWEPACGEGHLSKVLIEKGYDVKSTDLIDRNYGTGNIDFLKEIKKWNGDILTNPPFKIAVEFIEKSLELIEKGNKVIIFQKVNFLETKKRKEFFQTIGLKEVYIHSERIAIAKSGDFKKYAGGGKAVCYCWFVFEKGYKGNVILKWI